MIRKKHRLLQWACSLSVSCVALLSGCRQDMHNQPKFIPQRGTTFFADGRSARAQVSGSVARSQGDTTSYFTTGMQSGGEGDGMPVPVTAELLQRGQERYNIFCTPCHSRVGNGKGMIVQRGYYAAANLHTDRLRQAPLGHFFNVITNGYGVMPQYGVELPPADRWAVIAYIRALQLSQQASPSTDVPSGIRALPLKQQAVNAGFAEGFLQEWISPSTAMAASVVAAAPAPAAPAATATAPAAAESALTKTPGALPKPLAATATVGAADQPAPAEAEASAKPVHAAKKGDPQKGSELYMANCMMCHQSARQGLPPMIPSLIGMVERVGEDKVRSVIRLGIPEGKPPMPAHPSFSETDIDNVVAFLRTK